MAILLTFALEQPNSLESATQFVETRSYKAEEQAGFVSGPLLKANDRNRVSEGKGERGKGKN